MERALSAPSTDRVIEADPAAQARAVVRLLFDPRLQARVADRPESFADRFGFCPAGRELLEAGMELRARFGHSNHFTPILRLAVLFTAGIVERCAAGGEDVRNR